MQFLKKPQVNGKRTDSVKGEKLISILQILNQNTSVAATALLSSGLWRRAWAEERNNTCICTAPSFLRDLRVKPGIEHHAEEQGWTASFPWWVCAFRWVGKGMPERGRGVRSLPPGLPQQKEEVYVLLFVLLTQSGLPFTKLLCTPPSLFLFPEEMEGEGY